jgi:hypothetical protein
MKKLCFLIGALISLSANLCLAQKNIVGVNPLTGTANAVIPIYTMTNGGVSIPIELTYSATGIKPKDVEQNAGMGWLLVAGGSITRKVRGLPDDVKADALGNTRFGWMYNNNQYKIDTLHILNDGGVTCRKDTTDIHNIKADFGDLSDTEPDQFYVSAPGLSCQLIYDQSAAKFRPVSYQDLTITYTTYYTGVITSFTIVNDKGIKYVFSKQESDVISTTNPCKHNKLLEKWI